MNYQALLEGFLTGAGLIIAIGPQNTFVLKQGLRKNHILTTALSFALADMLLISAGTLGLGPLLMTKTLLLTIAKWGGALFLFVYGLLAFRSFLYAHKHLSEKITGRAPSLKKTIFIVAALSFLNPHAYLDTVVLLGTISTRFPFPYFGLGAILSSFAWFFALSYGARLLSPLLQNPTCWKVIDALTGCLMWTIAYSLLV